MSGLGEDGEDVPVRWDSTAHGPVRSPARAADRVPAGSNHAIPLLDLITRQSLDEDYLHVATRRRSDTAVAGDGDRAGRGRVALTVIVVLLFGLLVTVAAVQTSRDASVDSATKDQLIERINARRASVARLQQQIAELRTSTTHGQRTYAALGRQLDDVSATRVSLLRQTGWGEASGDGVKATIDDAPDGNSDGQVRDSDLAGLINGLWQAGATAVAVNGQRVTPLSALRNTASAVRINDFSLSPPYTVSALGDTRTLQARFAQSTSGIRLQNLTRQFGMPFNMHKAEHLTLPAAPSSMLVLRHASSVEAR